MSIASANFRNDYTGAGNLSVYAYTFRILDQSHLAVTVRDSNNVETTLLLTTNFTVSGVGNSGGGSITLVAGNLATGSRLTIRGKLPLTQVTDIRNQGAYYPEIHEDQFDRQVMIDQQQQDEIDRSLKLPSSVNSSDFNPILPASLVGGVSKSLITNATGTGFTAGPTADQITSAQASATAAASSATAASTSASGASTSATNAASSATAAAASASGASTSATNAASSATSASTSATSATSSASTASTNATNAATSATSASTSATNASTSATAASNSATAASTSATNASNSAASASTSATNAANSATSASTSATNASNSAAAAAASAAPTIQIKSAAYTALNTDNFIICTGASAFTITLYACSTATKPLIIKNAGTATITVARAGTDLIDNETSQQLSPLSSFGLLPDKVSNFWIY